MRLSTAKGSLVLALSAEWESFLSLLSFGKLLIVSTLLSGNSRTALLLYAVYSSVRLKIQCDPNNSEQNYSLQI